MRKTTNFFKCTTIFILCLYLYACGTLPKRFATAPEAYPNREIPQNIPKESIIRETYTAPYADVYRAAEMASTRAMLLPQSQNEDEGIILLRAQSEKYDYQGTKIDSMHFYKISIKEVGPSKTQVTVLAKKQTECELLSWGIPLAVITIILIPMIPLVISVDKECKEVTSQPQWITDSASDPKLAEVLNLIRFELQNQGLI